MLPYLHVGHFDLPTFGLMLVLAAVCATALLFANLGRFKIDADAIGIIATATIAGMLGGKLWHALQDPAYLLAHPSVLVDRSGFAWFGGLLGGTAALLWQSHAAMLRMLTILDLCAPSVALGYGIGRIGCFTSGNGDYGIASNLPWAMSFPHGTVPVSYPVHPTPLYECFVALAITFYLWMASAPTRRAMLHPGQITGEYFLLTGIARFLVEFIRINPRIYWGMSNAQVASLGSICIGAGLGCLKSRTRIRSRTGAIHKMSRKPERCRAGFEPDADRPCHPRKNCVTPRALLLRPLPLSESSEEAVAARLRGRPGRSQPRRNALSGRAVCRAYF